MVTADTVEQAGLAPSIESLISHFWVASGPFFETSLFLLPNPVLAESGVRLSHDLTLYDADGKLANTLVLEAPASRLSVIELKTILGACKFESGIKHGHLVVKSPLGSQHFCRLQTSEKATLLGKPVGISDSGATFFPVLLAEDRSSFLALVNHSETQAVVRIRLFCGKRTPEVDCSIPALGTRLFSVENAFSEQTALPEGKRMQSYLRIGTRSSAVIGMILIEQVKILNDKDFYSSVC